MERVGLTETQRELALRQFYSPTGDPQVDLEIIQPLLELEHDHYDELHMVHCPMCSMLHLVEMGEQHYVGPDPEEDAEARYRVTCQLLNEPFEIVSY